MEALSAVQMLSSVRCVCVRCVFTAPTHSPLLELEHTFSGQVTHFLCVDYWLNHPPFLGRRGLRGFCPAVSCQSSPWETLAWFIQQQSLFSGWS